MAKAKCNSCGVPFSKHLGLQCTCEKLEDAMSALKLILDYSTGGNGITLTPKGVIMVCQSALKTSDPNNRT